MNKHIALVVASAGLIGGSMMAVSAQATTHPAAKAAMQSVMLKAQAFSGVTGTATLTYNASTNMTKVAIVVQHLMPNSVHPAHIHAGVCTSNGPVVAMLNSVKADAMGRGTSTTTVKGQFINMKDYINVHYGPGLTLTQFTVLACGQI